MLMESIFSKFLIVVFFFWIGACSSRSTTQKGNKEISGESYNFITDSCSTGLHEFSGEIEGAHLAYCNALGDDAVNNNCAKDQRLRLFKEKCQESTESTNVGAPVEKNTEIPDGFSRHNAKLSGYGVPYKGQGIESRGRPSLDVLTRYQQFWTLKFNDFSFRFDSLAKPPLLLESVVQDFIDCGFSYDGPLCFEGQEKLILSQELLGIDEKEYLFTVFSYSPSSDQRFALFIEAGTPQEPEKSPEKNAYLYSLNTKDVSISPEGIIAEKGALAFATIKAKFLDADNIDSTSEKIFSTRQKLTLSHIKMSFPQFSESITAESSIQKNLKEQLDKILPDVMESNDPSIITLWLSLHQWIMPEKDYREFLASEERSNSKTFQREAALIEVMLGAFSPQIEKLYAEAISSDHFGQQHRAFNLARRHIGLTDKVLLGLVSTLNHPNYQSAFAAYEILAEYPLDDGYVEKLAKLTGKFGNNGSAYVFAYDLLKKIDTPLAHKVVISQLSIKFDDIRKKVYETIDYFLLKASFKPNSIESVAMHMKSEIDKSKKYASDILDQIDTPEATLVLLKFMDQDSFSGRSYIIDKILNRPEKKFTELHLELLKGYLEPRHPEQVLDPNIKYLFRLGSPNAILALLQFINKPKNFYMDDEERRTWMLSYLEKSQIIGIHCEQLGEGIKKTYDDVRKSFVNILLKTKNSESTSVLLDQLVESEGFMQSHYTEVLKELEYRFTSDKDGLFGGNCGLMLGKLFMKSRYGIFLNTKKGEPTDAPIIKRLTFYRITNKMSMDYLLSMRTPAALSSLSRFMGIKDDDLRQTILAIIDGMAEMPRETLSALSIHVRHQSAGCDSSRTSSCAETRYLEEFEVSPSPYIEVRELAYKKLFWIYRNTKHQRMSGEIDHKQDAVLDRIHNNIAPNMLESNRTSIPWIPVLYDEAMQFFHKVIDIEGDQILLGYGMHLFISPIISFGQLCKLDQKSYKKTLEWKLGFLQLLRRLPDPELITWVDEYFIRCPNYYYDYGELASKVIDLLGIVEPQVLLRDLATHNDASGRADVLLAMLAKILPPDAADKNRCDYLAETKYFDSRRVADLKVLADVKDPIVLPWLDTLVHECPELKSSNPDLSVALEKTLMSLP